MKFIKLLKAGADNKSPRTFYLYVGYYELYLTDHKLSKPYMYQDENTDLNQLINDNLSGVNDDGDLINPDAPFNTESGTVIIDKNILDAINTTDMFSGYADSYDSEFGSANDENEEEEINNSYNIQDLSEYYAD